MVEQAYNPGVEARGSKIQDLGLVRWFSRQRNLLPTLVPLWNLRAGGRELTQASCPLNSICRWQHIHVQNINVKIFLGKNSRPSWVYIQGLNSRQVWATWFPIFLQKIILKIFKYFFIVCSFGFALAKGVATTPLPALYPPPSQPSE